MATKQQKIFIKGSIFALIVALIIVLSRYGPQPFSVLGPVGENLGKFYTRRRRLARFLGSLGPYSTAVFILLQALQVVISPIPGELTGVVGGYVYGLTFGFLFSTVGLTLGSWVAFELASIFGRPLVERFVSGKVLNNSASLQLTWEQSSLFSSSLYPASRKTICATCWVSLA